MQHVSVRTCVSAALAILNQLAYFYDSLYSYKVVNIHTSQFSAHYCREGVRAN